MAALTQAQQIAQDAATIDGLQTQLAGQQSLATGATAALAAVSGAVGTQQSNSAAPAIPSYVWLIGAAVVGYVLWKKYK